VLLVISAGSTGFRPTATSGTDMARPLDDRSSEIETCHSVAGEDSFVLFVRVTSPTALEALIREIRRRAKVSTRTAVALQTFFENREHPVVGPDDTEPADRASPPWFHRSSSVCAGSILVRSGHVRVCPRCRD
jgi:Lrp/AsnC ligand binding domain